MLRHFERIVISRGEEMRQVLTGGLQDISCRGARSTTALESHIPPNWSGNERRMSSTVLTAPVVCEEYQSLFELRDRQGPQSSTGDLLSLIANWPYLPWHLHLEAVRILRIEGIVSLVRYGGQHAKNGLLTFNKASSTFQETVCRLLGHSAGFWDIDDSGVNWVVCPHLIAPERGPWPTWGFSFDGYQELVEAPARESARHQLGDSYGELQSVHQCPWPDNSIHRNVRVLQGALDLAGVLVAGANDDGECIVEPSDNTPDGIGDSSASRDLIGSLSELSRLSIALLDLLPDRSVGWMRRRSQAVTYFEVLDDRRVLVQISPDLRPMLQHFNGVFPAL